MSDIQLSGDIQFILSDVTGITVGNMKIKLTNRVHKHAHILIYRDHLPV